MKRSRILIVFSAVLLVLVGVAIGQLVTSTAYNATVEVVIEQPPPPSPPPPPPEPPPEEVAALGLYTDNTCSTSIQQFSFAAISDSKPNDTITTWLCNTGTVDLNVTLTLAKISGADGSLDNGPLAKIRMFISNWEGAIQLGTVSSRQLDFTAEINPKSSAVAVAGSYNWRVTVAGIQTT